jgi:acetyltransferase-like isoleucine patch superfamily enzyme
MKKNSATAEGLTVVTGSHPSVVGELFLKNAEDDIQIVKDVIVEEDVWIAANVTLLAGVVIGRGAVVGSGAVCRNAVPPYAIVVGNPAKIIGFKFSPEEIVLHEKALYPENERISIEILTKNYNKYFLNRIGEIKSFLK